MISLSRFLPFLNWLPLRADNIRRDLVAGITVALVLIPQSMAYAQLAGMPAYYGLYAAFLPGMIAALWGSSAQLATGPVAVVSLLTASALTPLAAVGSETFIAYAILLAFLVGIVQLALGLFKLGVVVNFLSHPVIVGFTNAAAIIIGLSQLNKIFGVSMGRSEHFIQDIWGVLLQVGNLHVPTFLMGVSAFAVMWGLKKYFPKLPGVLIAVALTTFVSWWIGFERNDKATIEAIVDTEVRTLAADFARTETRVDAINTKLAAIGSEIKELEKSSTDAGQRIAALKYEVELLKLELKDAERENRTRSRDMRKFLFERIPGTETEPEQLYLTGNVPQGVTSDGYRWRIKKIAKGELNLIGGGEVVGAIPAGLPSFDMPKFSWDMIVTLLSTAFVISLVGFMEAISIAKAMAAKTRQRIDPNQELIGQGFANVMGSLTHAFPTSGSFSRSAVNLNAGAVTGMSSVFTGVVVLITLLLLTPLLYHLPQAVLAAVIMMAVIGLVNFKAIKHAWQAHRHDGAAALVTFLATLGFAPHLDNGILVGAGLAIVLYLFRTMKPRVATIGRAADGTLRDALVNNLPTSENVITMRFDGSLYFANVSYFEDAILEAVAHKPQAKYVLVVGDGINQLDASGEEVIHHVVQRLRDNGLKVLFSGLKRQVIQVMQNTGLYDYIGPENVLPTVDMALDAIQADMTDESAVADLQLLRRPTVRAGNNT